MKSQIPSRLLGCILFIVLIVAIGYLFNLVSNATIAKHVVEPVAVADLTSKPWQSYTSDNSCADDLCLVIEHTQTGSEVHSIAAFLVSSPVKAGVSNEFLETRIVYQETDTGVSLTVRHIRTPSLDEAIAQLGINNDTFREPQSLYEVSGKFTWETAKIELSYGSLSQFFLDGFSTADRARGNKPDIDQLTIYAEILATEVNERFGISDLSERARTAMIISGPTQTLTYLAAFLAVLLTIAERWAPSLRSQSNGVADLIPFTGFLGTLIGVSDGLRILGLANITDDIDKAISLGKIGSSLGFAINTTILAIVVFGLVLVFQFAFRSFSISSAVKAPEELGSLDSQEPAL